MKTRGCFGKPFGFYIISHTWSLSCKGPSVFDSTAGPLQLFLSLPVQAGGRPPKWGVWMSLGCQALSRALREAGWVEWPDMLILWKSVESPGMSVVPPDAPRVVPGCPSRWSVALRAAGTGRQGSVRFLRRGCNVSRLQSTCPSSHLPLQRRCRLWTGPESLPQWLWRQGGCRKKERNQKRGVIHSLSCSGLQMVFEIPVSLFSYLLGQGGFFHLRLMSFPACRFPNTPSAGAADFCRDSDPFAQAILLQPGKWCLEKGTQPIARQIFMTSESLPFCSSLIAAKRTLWKGQSVWKGPSFTLKGFPFPFHLQNVQIRVLLPLQAQSRCKGMWLLVTLWYRIWTASANGAKRVPRCVSLSCVWRPLCVWQSLILRWGG